MVTEAPKHTKREPTHFTGLSLKLNMRLLCLFVVCVREKNRKEEEKRRKEETMLSVTVQV